MPEFARILCVGALVFFSFTLEGIAGFGSTILALPFVLMLIGIKQAVPLFSSMGWLIALFIVIRSRRNIRLKEFVFIAAHVACGVPLGLLLTDKMPQKPLLALLSMFMLVIGINGLRKMLVSKPQEKEPVPETPVSARTMLMRALLVCGGIFQGAFSSGGPAVVIYASRVLQDKSLFRVTLSMVWLFTNSIMLTIWTLKGDVWTPEIGKSILCALPFIGAGMLLGDYLHHRVNTGIFRIFVYSVLTAAAVILFSFRVL